MKMVERISGKPWFWGLVAVLAVVATAVASIMLSTPRGAIQIASVDQPTIDSDPESEKLVVPQPRPGGWVGSQACAECHVKICDDYSTHPMANSCASIASSKIVEDFDQKPFSGPDNRQYWSERTEDGRVFHHETLSDAQGVIYDQIVEVAYALGSGRHGRAYLAQRDGIITQSPITWYSQQRRWDLSPGYDPLSHERFERRIGDGCLYCHVGRAAPADRPDTYATPAFFEPSIGCERCHGPGESHIAFHSESEREGHDPIVNPARLAPEVREAACYVCHLQGRSTLRRFGRSFFDFRPGDKLQDILLIFVHGEGIDEQSQTMPVSQVEQMRVSRCFIESEGRMGCTSCHDPHRIPDDRLKAVYYRDRCYACHEDQDCAAPLNERSQPTINNSCVACHMPPLRTQAVAHTSLTDHRIRRKPMGEAPTDLPADPSKLELFATGTIDIPAREMERARGLLFMQAAEGLRSREAALAAQHLLIPRSAATENLLSALPTMENDPEALNAMGQSLRLTGHVDDAETFWQAALRAQPNSEEALFNLALSRERFGDQEGALNWLDKLAAVNPYVAEVHFRRAQLLAKLNRAKDAIEAAKKGLEIDPTRLSLQELLALLYQHDGQRELAQQQTEVATRIREAMKGAKDK